uniref:Uncharacterized protein n=1 Tax=Pinctada fucata TaxID=50426 RepID=A0A194ANI6_PINFU
MKLLTSILTLVLVNFYHCFAENGTFTDAEKDFIATMPFYELPQKLRFNLLGKKTGDRSHYCCSGSNFQETGWKTLSKEISSYQTVTHSISRGSKSCGFLWAKRCSNGYYTQYSQRLVTRIQYSRIKTYNRCPDELVTCCTHFMNVSGNCLDEAEVTKYHDALVAIFHNVPIVG